MLENFNLVKIFYNKNMTYQPYLGWGLNNFEDVMEAFTKFPKGGWWIRKIDHKDAFDKEYTEGPYDEKTAKRKAATWNNFFKFKDIKPAVASSFNDLVCNYKERQDLLKEKLYPEYIWVPPKGSQLLCIDRVMLLKKILLKDTNFDKFSVYVQNKNIKMKEYREYLIYYKDKDNLAYEQSKKLEKLIDDYQDFPDQLWALYNKALGKDNKVDIIPYYIKDFNKYKKPYTLEFFNRFNKLETRKNKIKCFINSIKSEKRDFNFSEKNDYNLGYQFPIIFHKEDDKTKNFLVSKNNQGKLIIEIKEKDFFVKLEAPTNEEAQLTFNLPMEDNEDFFNDKLITFILFLSKKLNIFKINLKDNLREYCKCDKVNNQILYINIIRFLADRDSLYQEMGFQEDNIDKRRDVINTFKDKKISSFINMGQEELMSEKTLSQLAIDYLDGFCNYDYVCHLLHMVSVKIFESLKDCCFEYHIDLEEFPLKQLEEKLK